MDSKRIRELEDLIKREHDKMRHCQHDFGVPFHNPLTVREFYGSKHVGRGSDHWYEPEGYHDVQKPQWTRVCAKCGGEEHTDKQRPIVSHNEPDFGH